MGVCLLNEQLDILLFRFLYYHMEHLYRLRAMDIVSDCCFCVQYQYVCVYIQTTLLFQ